MENTFTYNGFTFKPVRKLKITEAHINDFSKLIDWKIKLKMNESYNYDAFYKESGNSHMDVFQCLENGKYYVPCDNCLMGMKGN